MDKIFFIGIIVGIISRLIMLNLDDKQYPTQPNILTSQIVLAFVASSLGALLIPALVNRSYTSITFLSFFLIITKLERSTESKEKLNQ